jgi:hypothetical protein
MQGRPKTTPTGPAFVQEVRVTTLNNETSNALAQIKDDLSRFELEPDLRNSVKEHYQHLESLAASLRKLGIDGKTIDHHVTQIFEKYRVELMRNIERLELA